MANPARAERPYILTDNDASPIDLDVVVQIGATLLASLIRMRDYNAVSDAELDRVGDLAVRAAIAFEWKAQDVAKIRATRLANEAAERAAGTAAALHAKQQDLSRAHDEAEAKDRAVREAEANYNAEHGKIHAQEIATDQKEADAAAAESKVAGKAAAATPSYGHGHKQDPSPKR